MWNILFFMEFGGNHAEHKNRGWHTAAERQGFNFCRNNHLDTRQILLWSGVMTGGRTAQSFFFKFGVKNCFEVDVWLYRTGIGCYSHSSLEAVSKTNDKNGQSAICLAQPQRKCVLMLCVESRRVHLHWPHNLITIHLSTTECKTTIYAFTMCCVLVFLAYITARCTYVLIN